MVLQSIEPDRIWHVQQPVRFGPLTIKTRAMIVRLADGGLWVHSPVTPTPDLVNALNALGPVRFVVAPNKAHHLYFHDFMQAFPEAKGFIAPGLADKRPALQSYESLGTSEGPDWSPDLQSHFVPGLPVLNETVWFHPSSGTLILTDLLFNLGKGQGVLLGLVARLLGVHDRLAMSRTMKFMVKDKAAVAASARHLLSLPVRRIVLAHDQIIEEDAAARMKTAFGWLLK